jgi:site-specific DNA-adenine methylase
MCGMIPPHHTYIEGFAGAAWFMLNKPPSEYEIVNDINKTLINMWMTIRDHPDRLAKECEMLPDSEELYKKYELIATYDFKHDFMPGIGTLDPDTWTTPEKWKVELATAFLYLNAHSYSSLFTGQHGKGFKTDPLHQKSWNEKVEMIRNGTWDRIKNVMFTCRSIFDLLRENCDRDDVFIYLDPPYFDGGWKYAEIPGGKEWNMTHFIELRKLVQSFKHAKVLISIDNGEFFLGEGWQMVEVEKKKKLRAEAEIGRECLVFNYDAGLEKNVNTFDPLQF